MGKGKQEWGRGKGKEGGREGGRGREYEKVTDQ